MMGLCLLQATECGLEEDSVGDVDHEEKRKPKKEELGGEGEDDEESACGISSTSNGASTVNTLR
jgi:hypothetical protein